jgi:hypothetical protein
MTVKSVEYPPEEFTILVDLTKGPALSTANGGVVMEWRGFGGGTGLEEMKLSPAPAKIAPMAETSYLERNAMPYTTVGRGQWQTR